MYPYCTVQFSVLYSTNVPVQYSVSILYSNKCVGIVRYKYACLIRYKCACIVSASVYYTVQVNRGCTLQMRPVWRSVSL